MPDFTFTYYWNCVSQSHQFPPVAKSSEDFSVILSHNSENPSVLRFFYPHLTFVVPHSAAPSPTPLAVPFLSHLWPMLLCLSPNFIIYYYKPSSSFTFFFENHLQPSPQWESIYWCLPQIDTYSPNFALQFQTSISIFSFGTSTWLFTNTFILDYDTPIWAKLIYFGGRRNSKGIGSDTGMSKLLLQVNVAQSHWRPSETLGGKCFRTDAKRDKKAELFIHQSLSLTIDGHSWDITFLELLVWLYVLCSSAYIVAREWPQAER